MQADIEEVSRRILEVLPQKPPFRFLDRVVEISDGRIVGEYTFKKDESFYTGHFPGRPTTPGVILVETMAQTAVVAFGIYLLAKEAGWDEVAKGNYVSLFTDVEAEFVKEVPPGARVVVKADKVFWRRKKLRCNARLYLDTGELAAMATLSGIGVER